MILDLHDIARGLKKYLLVLVALVAAGAVIAGLTLRYRAPEYTATASFLVGANLSSSTAPDYATYAVTHQLVFTGASLATSDSVLNEAIAACGLQMQAEALSPFVQVKIPNGSDMVVVQVTNRDVNLAVRLTNAIVAAVGDKFGTLKTTVPAKITVVDAAVPPQDANHKNYVKAGSLGAVAGLVAGLLFVLFASSISTRAKKDESIARASRLEPLGDVPEGKTVAQQAESCRAIAANLRAAAGAKSTIAFVSAHNGDGRTETLLGVAAAMAEAGFSTLLVDADVSGSVLTQKLGRAGAPGLTEYLAGSGKAQEMITHLENENYDLLPAGKATAATVGAKKTAQLFAALAEQYDYILVDAPAAEAGAACFELAAMAGRAAAVLRYNKTRLSQAATLAEKLRRCNADVAGYVLFGTEN